MQLELVLLIILKGGQLGLQGLLVLLKGLDTSFKRLLILQSEGALDYYPAGGRGSRLLDLLGLRMKLHHCDLSLLRLHLVTHSLDLPLKISHLALSISHGFLIFFLPFWREGFPRLTSGKGVEETQQVVQMEKQVYG